MFLLGIKDSDLGMNSPFMWLHGDNSDRGIQCLNFQGTGVSPWMHPRLDASMMGMQPDMYQAMAAAALQEMRAVDYSKMAPASFLQFQESQGLPCQSSTLMQPQMLHQSQPQQAFIQSVQENQQHSQSQSQSQAQTQSHQLQPLLQPQQSFDSQQQQHQQQPRQPQQLVDHQQIPCTIPAISQFQSQSPSLQTIPSLCQQPRFSDSNCNPGTSPTISPLHSLAGSFVQDETSQLLNLQRVNSIIPSAGWRPSKRAAIDPLSTGASQYFLPQVENLGTSQSSISQNTVALPPFPGRECSIDDRDENDPQNHVLFGVNIESSSLLMQNGMSNLRGVGNDSISTTLPFSSNYMTTAGTDFSVNPTMTSSNCIDETGFLQSHENVGQVNPPNGTFVKVIHRAGTFCFFSLNVWITYLFFTLHYNVALLVSLLPSLFTHFMYRFINQGPTVGH